MKRLFIIGNGFDCYLHKLPTMYSDFRKYILRLYPDIKESVSAMSWGMTTIPTPYAQADGGTEYDPKDSAAFIVSVIDACGDENWSCLEHYLGDEAFKEFGSLYTDLDFEQDDRDLKVTALNNEENAKHIQSVFRGVKSLFVDWVNTDIANLNFKDNYKDYVADVIAGDSMFLNFNYSRTLEVVYSVNPDNICYIHGVVGDRAEDVIFGHGDDGKGLDGSDTIEVEMRMSELKDYLRKDTGFQINKNESFFGRLKDVVEVYSFGFSFSDVDMPYVKKIAESVSKGAVWFLNSYAWSKDLEGESRVIDKLKKIGFEVAVESRW